MSERKMIHTTLWEMQKTVESIVSGLNRLIRQHPESPSIIVWIGIKEVLENEILGYEVIWET